jgi:hypothetical protein
VTRFLCTKRNSRHVYVRVDTSFFGSGTCKPSVRGCGVCFSDGRQKKTPQKGPISSSVGMLQLRLNGSSAQRYTLQVLCIFMFVCWFVCWLVVVYSSNDSFYNSLNSCLPQNRQLISTVLFHCSIPLFHSMVPPFVVALY